MITLVDLPRAACCSRRVSFFAGLVLRRALHHRHGHRRRVRGDQLGDRRADPQEPSRARRRVDQRQLLAGRDRRLAAGRADAQHEHLPDESRLAAVVRARRGDRPGGAARSPQRAREPALAVHPRPRGGGREDRQGHRSRASNARPANRCPRPRASRWRSGSASAIPLHTIVRTVVTKYPRRTVLGLSLFIGQAFLYNSILFGFANLLTPVLPHASGNAPYYIAVFAAATSPARCCSARCSTSSGASR